MAQNDGGPAFPGPYGSDGMSLRDWFAGQALAGLLSQEGVEASPETDAAWAYKVADAMLAARRPPESEGESDV